MSNQLSIEEIVKGCKKGNPKYQKALVDRFSEQLYTVCLRYIGESNRAQDVLQDSFIRIFKAINNYDPDRGSLGGWMRKITVNMSLKTLNKKKIKTTGLEIDLHNMVSVAPTALSRMANEELLEIVQTLPEGYRQVFNLSVIEGYNHREIGEMLGIKEVSSRSNLSRAKEILRKKLKVFKNSELWVNII